MGNKRLSFCLTQMLTVESQLSSFLSPSCPLSALRALGGTGWQVVGRPVLQLSLEDTRSDTAPALHPVGLWEMGPGCPGWSSWHVLVPQCYFQILSHLLSSCPVPRLLQILVLYKFPATEPPLFLLPCTPSVPGNLPFKLDMAEV